MSSGLKSVVLCASLLLAACASGQSGNSSSPASAPVSAAAGSGQAAALDVLVDNTIVRVANVPNEALIRAELEEFGSGLFWSRGTRQTDAVIEIGGTGSAQTQSEGGQDAVAVGFGESILFGTISLVDVATGEVVVAPFPISVEVTSNRDVYVGITEGSKDAVELEYLVQKFILAGREALYGKGV